MGRESGCRVCWNDKWPDSHRGSHGRHFCDMLFEVLTEAEETSWTLLCEELSKAEKTGELGTYNAV